MKKSLLLAAALVAATSVFAQRAELKNAFDASNMASTSKALVKQTLPRLEKQNLRAGSAEVASPRRSKASGTYYYMTGGLYLGFNAEGNGVGYSVYEVAPFTPFQIIGSVAGDWSWNGTVSATDVSEITDYSYPLYWGYAPSLTNGEDTWNFGDNNLYGWYGYNGGASYASYQTFANGLVGSDSICMMFPADDHYAYMYRNSAYSCNQNWGYLDSDNLFGTGNVIDEENEQILVSYGAVQPYKALHSPLYVESLCLKGLSFSTTPMAEGTSLQAIIMAGDDAIDTLYCQAADVDPFEEDDYGRNNKTVYNGVLNFYKKSVDAFGNESIEPVVIPANVDFEIIIKGFDKEGIDFGAEGLSFSDEDENAQRAYMLITDGENAYASGYQSAICLNLGIVGMFDIAHVLESKDFGEVPEGIYYNGLHFSDDGATCYTEGLTKDQIGGEYDNGAIGVETAIQWFDEEDNANYELVSDDDIDWITGYTVDDSYFQNTSSALYGIHFLSFAAEALPAGVSGRSAIVYIQGHGVTSGPIFLAQGDATIPAALNSVKVDTQNSDFLYNIAGQRANANTKGIVIKNGKKILK